MISKYSPPPNSYTLQFTNRSNLYIMVGDGGVVLFSGTYEECEKYTNDHPLQYSGYSNYSIVKPGGTITIHSSSGDSES